MSRFRIEPELSKNARFIVEKRYLATDKDGNPKETPKQMFKRVSKFIASAENDTSDKKKGYKQPTKEELETIEDKFFEMQARLEFLSGMSLLDRGHEELVAACYVMPIHDSVESIYGTLANTTTLHRRGAGIGYDWSEVRPEGDVVKSTGREASGPISFMRLYDFSSETIMNRGSQRHAGHMGILRVDHPDIKKFISAKQDYSQLTNFNISVAITDEFVRAVKENTNFDLKFEGKVYETVDARELLRTITESIYKSGEPGFIFIDEVNRSNPTPNVGDMTATNQCGEQPLLPYEACNLGSVVLSKFFIADSESDNPDKRIDWDRLEEVVKLGVRFLDNTITVSRHLLPEIEEIVKHGNRKVGIGVMGWADLLYLLEIPYDTKTALNLAERIMKFINEKAREGSEELGKERGDFGNFKGSRLEKKYTHMRNATVTTIAPNGTTSLVADVNGGIEPVFALAYVRKNMETVGADTEMVIVNKIFEEKLKAEWLYDQELMKKVAEAGTISSIKEIPDKLKKVFVTTYDIDPSWHIKMQGAFQKYTDNAVSKTINIHQTAGVEEIEEAFFLAVEEHLKGLTIYRDKSRDKQVLNV